MAKHNIQSTLGNFLREDCQDFIPTSDGAAVFHSEEAAAAWIEANYGKNGSRFMRPTWVRRGRNEEEDE